MIRLAPSIAKPGEMADHCDRLNAELAALPLDVAWFERDFAGQGQGRSVAYEAELRALFSPYGRGFTVYPAVKPDYIVEEYRACAVTAARDHSEITEAIRRSCHVIEFTAYLQSDMRGLKEYLLGKVERYAELLESV